jgi:methionine sulfoxide reductase heme-binding subunit
VTTAALVTPADWYLMRGSGLVALVLLSLTVAIGVVGVQRWESASWPRFVTGEVHRNLSLLAVAFLGVHVVTAVLDGWIHLAWVDTVVPFASAYRPVWVGLGAVAVDLVLAIVLTSLLRRHIGYRSWRIVHWATWLAWPVAVLHAVGIGSDTRAGFGLFVVLACVGLVGLAALWRLSSLARTKATVWLDEWRGYGTEARTGTARIGGDHGRSRPAVASSVSGPRDSTGGARYP